MCSLQIAASVISLWFFPCSHVRSLLTEWTLDSFHVKYSRIKQTAGHLFSFVLEPWPRHNFCMSSDTVGLSSSVKLRVFVCCSKRQTTHLLTFHPPALQLLARWCFSGVVLYVSTVVFYTVCKSRPCVLFLIGMAVELERTGFPKPHQPAVDFLNDSAVQASAEVWLCIFHFFDCRVAGFGRVLVVVFL